MGGFFYFIPDQVTRVAELPAWGLEYAFERGAEFAVVGARGPGASAGTIVADGSRTTRVGYYPAEQDWRRIVPPGGNTEIKSGAWVGMATGSPPAPDDLLRRDALAGYAVRLLDGREWTVPVARGLGDEDGELRYRMCVPAKLALDETGQWVGGEVTPRWRELWETAERFWNAFVGGGVDRDDAGIKVSLAFGDIASAAVTALGGNYRVRRDEVAMLGLLDQANSVEICRALVDMPKMEAWIKKKAQRSEAGTAAS